MRNTRTISQGLGALVVIGALGACGTSGTGDVVAPAAGVSVAPAPAEQPTVPPAAARKTAATPDPSRTDWCGVVTGYDSKRGRVTVRTYASYQWGGESIHYRPERATFTVRTDGRTLVQDQAGDRNKRIDGTLAQRLAYAKRLGSGDKRAYVRFEDGFVEITVNNAVAGTLVNGCLSGTTNPDRPDFCGVITGYDAKNGTVTVRAFASYVWGGETFDYRAEKVTFIARTDGRTLIDDLSDDSLMVDGTLAERLAYAKRHGSGDKRAYVRVEDGFVEIEVNKPVRGKLVNGCLAVPA